MKRYRGKVIGTNMYTDKITLICDDEMITLKLPYLRIDEERYLMGREIIVEKGWWKTRVYITKSDEEEQTYY